MSNGQKGTSRVINFYWSLRHIWVWSGYSHFHGSKINIRNLNSRDVTVLTTEIDIVGYIKRVIKEMLLHSAKPHVMHEPMVCCHILLMDHGKQSYMSIVNFVTFVIQKLELNITFACPFQNTDVNLCIK